MVDTCDQTPLEIQEAAAAAVEDLLPKKSKSRYNAAYEGFDIWCKAKNVNVITEDVLLAYFAEKTKQNYKASSLWSHYSMVKSTLLIKKNVDIGKFSKLIAYLKRQNDEYQAKKSRILSRIEVNRFLQEAPDKEFLMSKVGNYSLLLHFQ
jgi:hypothetical protein